MPMARYPNSVQIGPECSRDSAKLQNWQKILFQSVGNSAKIRIIDYDGMFSILRLEKT